MQQLVEVAHARGGDCADRARRYPVDAHAFRAEACREIAHAGFEARLGEAHHVVIGQRARRSEVAQGDDGARAAFHHRQPRLHQRHQAVGAHVMSDAKALTRYALQEIPGERLARRERDRMHDAVEAVPAPGECIENRAHLRIARYIARQHDIGVEFGSQLLHPLAHAFALVGECELRSLAAHGARHSIGDRAPAEQARHEDLLSFQKSHGARRPQARANCNCSPSRSRILTLRPSTEIQPCAQNSDSMRLTVSHARPR